MSAGVKQARDRYTATMVTLKTDRLLLRPFCATDIDDYARMCADPEVTRYLGDGRPLSRSDAWRQMAMLVGHWHLKGYGMWAIEERDGGRLIGRIGCHYPEGWPGPANERSIRLAERLGERAEGTTEVHGQPQKEKGASVEHTSIRNVRA